VVDEAKCRCGNEETIRHLILSCPRWTDERRELTIEAATGETALDEPPESLIDFVREIQQKDAYVHVDHDREPTAGYERDLHGLLRFHGRVVVPIIAALRHEILKRNHDDQVASGHYGVLRTAELISRKYH
jgi:hypothetical protein